MSGRPSTSRARDSMMQVRGSEGSRARGPALAAMPREAFQRLRDSSSWSAAVSYQHFRFSFI